MQENNSDTNKEIPHPEDIDTILKLNNQEQLLKSKSSYLKAYSISILFPPSGLFYFIKFFFFGEGSDEERKAAIFCLILTVASFLISALTLQMLFSQAVNVNDPKLEILKELITPENQDTLRELLQ